MSRLLRLLSLVPLALETLLFLSLFKALVCVRSKASIKAKLGLFQSETLTSLSVSEAKTVKTIARLIQRISRRLPWKSLCLDKALTAQRLLAHRGIASTLYLGMIKNEKKDLTAHAWLRAGPIWVTGFHPNIPYTLVATYATLPQPSPRLKECHR